MYNIALQSYSIVLYMHETYSLFVWSFCSLAFSLFAYFSLILSCLEQIFISCLVSFYEADCCHGNNSPQMEAREQGVHQRVFTGSDTKLVDTHTWYSRYDENLCVYQRSRAHTHTYTHLTTDWFTVTVEIGSVLLRHKFYTQMEEKGNDLSMWFCFMMFYCWCFLLLWGNLCSVFDTVGWINGKVYPSKHLSLFI